MTGAWNTNMPGLGATLTIAKLKAIADSMPPRLTFASSVLFPNDHAWHFRDGREEFTCGGPAFWKAFWQRLEADRDLQGPARPPPFRWTPLDAGGITVLDIDGVTTDTPGLTEWRARQRKRVMAAVCRALGQVFDEEALS
jgi:hypothetical protein